MIHRPHRGPSASRSTGLVVAVSLSLGVAACGGSADDDPVAVSASADATEAAGARLLDAGEFAPLLDAPDVTVINVHVPYEGELPETDAFVPYDQVVGADALPADTDATIALYCRSGSMSEEASAALVEAGYTDVRDLEGGMIAWEQSGRDLLVEEQ